MFPNTTKVLVVDDFKTMRRLVVGALATLGLTKVTEADDGATAWPIIQEAAKAGEPFQLIVSDWNMPQMQGIQLLKNVRAHADAKVKGVPFVLVTAEAEQKNIVEALQVGVSNYIVKPFTPAAFGEKLAAVFKKHNT